MKRPKILVVGSYATGLVMEVDRLPTQGETLIGHSFRSGHGGKGSNQAVQAARLGADVCFLVSVGGDTYGDSLEALLHTEDIQTNGVLRQPELPTGVGFIVVDPEGNNLITVDLGANNALSPELLREHHMLFEQVDIVLAQMEIPAETALAALQLGRESGAITILNPAPAVCLKDHNLSSIDFITPNETEAAICVGKKGITREEAVDQLLKMGCRNVVMTTGAAGCTWTDVQGGNLMIPGFEVRAIDTVGAGDAFSAALAVGLGERKWIGSSIPLRNIIYSLVL